MDFDKLLVAARCAQAAYIMDPAKARAAFEAMGHRFIAQFKDADSQAVLSVDASGRTCFSISGTRFSDRQVPDLLDDMDLLPVSLGDGIEVTRGAYESAKELFAWALAHVDPGAVLNVSGHSLGGWRTSYTPLFVPAAQIGSLTSIEPPKGANAAYYTKYAVELANMITIGNGHDIWVGYPRLGDWMHRPGDMLHLNPTGFEIIDTAKWPGGFSLEDHDIDLVVSRLEALAAQPLKPAA